MTQNNLGDAYSERIRGERAENLEAGDRGTTSRRWRSEPARHSLSSGLRPSTTWAMPTMIASAASERRTWRQAIAAFQRALEVYTHQAFPEQWARHPEQPGQCIPCSHPW